MIFGLGFRFVQVGLPFFVVKYAGSALWALMIYWIVSTICLSSRILPVFLLSGFVATAVEFFKLYPPLPSMPFALHCPGFYCWGDSFPVGTFSFIGLPLLAAL